MLRKIKHLERVLRCKSTFVIISFVFFVLLAIYGFVKKERRKKGTGTKKVQIRPPRRYTVRDLKRMEKKD